MTRSLSHSSVATGLPNLSTPRVASRRGPKLPPSSDVKEHGESEQDILSQLAQPGLRDAWE